MSVDDRLRELGLQLPEAVAPAFQYVAVVVHGGYAWVSGQIPRAGSRVLMTGKVGAEISVEQARVAARACVLAALSQLKEVLGDLDRIERVVKVTGFVASAAGFVRAATASDRRRLGAADPGVRGGRSPRAQRGWRGRAAAGRAGRSRAGCRHS